MLLQYRMENRIPPIKPTQAMMDSSFSMKVLFIHTIINRIKLQINQLCTKENGQTADFSNLSALAPRNSEMLNLWRGFVELYKECEPVDSEYCCVFVFSFLQFHFAELLSTGVLPTRKGLLLPPVTSGINSVRCAIHPYGQEALACKQVLSVLQASSTP